MKKLIAKIIMLALLVLPLGLAFRAGAIAVPYWDVTNSYVVAFNYLSTDYSHDMVLAQDSSGNLTGSGGNPAGSPHVYTWVLTSGSVNGNSIDFDANYTATADAVTPQTTMHVTGTIALGGTMSGTWSDNYQGGTRTGTWTTTSGVAAPLGTLSAEDFGAVNYDTGLGWLRGYTAGFGLTNETFAGVQSVVVKLYSDSTLLQTNTGTAKIGTDITGTQISSPFDVYGNFDYSTDGYWTNTRETKYGQTLIPSSVEATVVLANGKTVTATNSILTGDPTTIVVLAAPVNMSPADGVTLTTAALDKITWSAVSDPFPPVKYYYEASYSPALGLDGSFTTPIYASGVLTTPEILTPGTTAGIYYWHVRAEDNVGNTSAWSTVWSIIVDNTPIPTTPTNKDQCKNDGWKTFNNPTFKNQGQCVSYLESNIHAGKR